MLGTHRCRRRGGSWCAPARGASSPLPVRSRCATEVAFAEGCGALPPPTGPDGAAKPCRAVAAAPRRRDTPALPAGIDHAIQRFLRATHGRHARDARRGGQVRSVHARIRGVLGHAQIMSARVRRCIEAVARRDLSWAAAGRARMPDAAGRVQAAATLCPAQCRCLTTPRRAGRYGLRRGRARKPFRDVAVSQHLRASGPTDSAPVQASASAGHG